MKRHPYITATVLATLLSIVVWLLVPKKYSASTKISDEYKEVDLAIGMDMLKAQIKAATGGSNTGMNEIETYSKTLKTEDFARSISHKQVPGKNMTYGQYLGVKDTIETIQDNIGYNYSSRAATLTLSFTDSDPLVAAQMLDSVTAQLQYIITSYRHRMAQAALASATKNLKEAEEEYYQARDAYNRFADANYEAETAEVQGELQTLAKATETAFKHYEDATSQYTRHLALSKRPYSSFAVIKSNTVPHQTNHYFLSYFLSFVIIALILTKGLILYKDKRRCKSIRTDWGDFFSPWSLTIFIWGADIALYFLQGTLDPIGPQFITSLTLWLTTLLLTSLLAYWLTGTTTTPSAVDYKKPMEVPRTLFNFLCIIAGILTLMYAHRVWGIVSRFGMDNLLYNLRLYVIEDNSAVGLLHHVQSLNFALFVIGLWMYPKISKLQLTYIVLVNLVFEIFRMEKSGILIMILGTMFVLYARKTIRMRSIMLTFAGIIVLFFFFNLSKEHSESTQDTQFLDFFGMYVTSPMVAFEHLTLDIGGTFGQNTFCIIYPYLNMFGLHLDYTQRLQEFVFVPIPTNVYTIMQPFYNDFGNAGIAFFGFLYGSFFGYIYRKVRNGDPACLCIYTYLVQVILIQFYNDNLLQNIVLFIEFCFIVIILTQQRYKLSLDIK